jgi:hypothetical protein
LQTKILIRFHLEESDLALVPFFVAEVPVPGDPLSGDALNLSGVDGGMVAGRLFVMAEIVVPGGNEQMKDFKINANHERKYSVSQLPRKAGQRRSCRMDGRVAGGSGFCLLVCDRRRRSLKC